MNKYTLVALSVTGGILSGLAWSGWCSGLILLIGLVPFFLIENYLYEHRANNSPNAFFIYTLPGFLIFSILSLGWIRMASIVAAICVITGMTFLMAFTSWVAHVVRLKAGNILSVAAIFSFWLGYEYLCLNFDLITPWVNLGNGLAKDILFIQWYEVTGTAGGTLWILLSNLLLSVFLIRSSNGIKHSKHFLYIWILVIIVPSIFSISRFLTLESDPGKASEVVIVQPNLDPYKEKFTTPFEEQLKKVIGLAEKAISEKTEWLITPETTIDDPVDENDLNNNKYIQTVRELIKRHPGITVLAGMTTYRKYPTSLTPPTRSARKIGIAQTWYDHFNSAVQIDSGTTINIYHKSKLVPGIEKQFTSGAGSLLGKILPYLGGSQWGYGTQNDRVCFKHAVTGIKIAPVICYESVFGKYLTGFVKNGANAFVIITNDGWWKNTNGYKQHLYFASIRAIESRRPIARAANTGISCTVDIKGSICNESEWWKEEVLKTDIFPGDIITPYVRYGDYLMLLGSITSILILVIVFVGLPVRKKFK
jgi:apolipoprotein N-acyltransferase